MCFSSSTTRTLGFIVPPIASIDHGGVRPLFYRCDRNVNGDFPVYWEVGPASLRPLRGSRPEGALAVLARARRPSSARSTSLSGLPTSPKRSRIFFSRYRRYEKWGRPLSFTKTNTGGAPSAALVAFVKPNPRPLLLRGRCLS